MIKIESAIQKVTRTTIKNTPVIKYMVPIWDKMEKKTTWYNVTAWNPANPGNYRNGRKATITITRKARRNGGYFYNQRSIEFATVEEQLTLPGM